MVEKTAEKATQKTKWHKRQWIIDVKAQHELILYFVTMGTIFFFSGALATNILQRFATISENWQYNRGADVLLLAVVVIFIIVSIAIGVVISNRLAGPINRIIREMEKAKTGGKMMKIEVRTNDYYKNLASAFNDVVDQLGKISERKDINPDDNL
jgi:nitrogen fixation/metabolism regulation signal transduction histidine kinase